MSLKVLGIGLIVVVLSGLIGLLSWGMVNKTPATGLSGKTRVDKPALDFRLSSQNGAEFLLSEHLGNPIVINFWASWCQPCRVEAPVLERTWRRYRDQNLVLVGVNIQDDQRPASAFIREFGITYPNGPDVDGIITIDYGVIGLPVTFFVNRNGTVERRWVGAIDEATAEAWVAELIAGTEPSGVREAENLEEFLELE